MKLPAKLMKPADGFLALVIARMRFAGHHQLKGVFVRKGHQPSGVLKEQQRTLVAGHSPSEPNDRGIGIEVGAGQLFDELDEVLLGGLMGVPDFVLGQLQHADENLGLVLPLRKVRIEESRESRMSPGPDMHAVGDGMDAVPGKHLRSRLRMASRDPVHIVREVEGEAGHVEAIVAGEALQSVEIDETGQQPLEKLVKEAVMASLDGRVVVKTH